MPQITSWTIANSGGSTYRAAVNSALAAIQSTSSGTAAPSPTVAGMLWYDTTNSILKRRNTANTAWVDVNSDTVGATTVRGNASGSAAAETAVSMASLRTMVGFPTTLTGLGQFVYQFGASGTGGTLPAGGTWAYWFIQRNDTALTVTNAGGGINAGGTTYAPATGATQTLGWLWRIS